MKLSRSGNTSRSGVRLLRGIFRCLSGAHTIQEEYTLVGACIDMTRLLVSRLVCPPPLFEAVVANFWSIQLVQVGKRGSNYLG